MKMIDLLKVREVQMTAKEAIRLNIFEGEPDWRIPMVEGLAAENKHYAIYVYYYQDKLFGFVCGEPAIFSTLYDWAEEFQD